MISRLLPVVRKYPISSGNLRPGFRPIHFLLLVFKCCPQLLMQQCPLILCLYPVCAAENPVFFQRKYPQSQFIPAIRVQYAIVRQPELLMQQCLCAGFVA